MAIEFDIQVRNGTVKITVGGQSSNTGNRSGFTDDHGKNAGTGTAGHGDSGNGTDGQGKDTRTGTIDHGKNAGTGTAGREAGGAGCCAPVVIGPIVISGGGMGNDSNDASGGHGKNAGTGTGGHGKNAGTGTGGHGKNAGTGTGGANEESGKGNDGGGSCGCAPLVIGPIVISGCYSGQDAGSTTGSEAITVNPPVSEVLNAPAQPFKMQSQQQSNWCWAAVAVSINDFLNPPAAVGGFSWTQSTLATQLLKEQGITSPPCIDTPESRVCNQPQALDVALAITQNLRPEGALARKYLNFDCIQNWVNMQLPVAARIKWRGEGAHFITLDGCKLMTSGQQLVHVQDPDPHTSPTLWDYDDLVEHYQEEGYWRDTYLVMPSKPQN